MPSAEYDLRYLNAAIPEMERYLLSKEIYWPLRASAPAGEPPFPQLTLGNMLLAQARLHARDLNETQRGELARIDEQLDEVRSRWHVAWEQKAAAEFRARLNLWRDYLEDYRNEPENNTDRFDYEVQRRAMLHLLEPEARDISAAQREMLLAMDNLLRGVLVSGPFIWDPSLEGGFPAAAYWYLYGRPRKQLH